MKIILLTLSGDPARAREDLIARFPDATVELLARFELERRTSVARVRLLRSLKPDLFAVATERLVWQRGQDAFLLLGALAGARASIIFDAHAGWREETKAQALKRAPARLTREYATSRAALTRAMKELRRLEALVAAADSERFAPRKNGTSRPSIVYIRSSPGPGTHAGGAASHINGFLNAVLQLGANVTLVSNDEIAGLDSTKIPAKIIWPEPIGSTRSAFDIHNNLLFTDTAIQEIVKVKPDFIYQRYARFSWSGVAASLRGNLPLFLEYNGSEVWVGEHWDRVDRLDLLARYEQLNLRSAAKIFVVSEVERQQLLSEGFDGGKIIVNPNGADVERFKPLVGGELVRHDLGFAGDDVVVGFLGTFGPWHGVEVLAEAILKLPADAKVRFLFVGGGALKPRVEQVLSELVSNRRAIFTGSVGHERVPALLDACDILVSPHVPLAGGRAFFGSPTKLFEYMAMGKAIVASRLGQIADVLSNNETALLVEPGDAEQLAEAMARLTASEFLRRNLGDTARREVVAKHTWRHNAQRVLDAFPSWKERKG